MAAKWKRSYPYLYLVPFLLLIIVFQFLPVVFTILIAFTNLDAMFLPQFNGLQNFVKIFGDVNLPGILSNTAVYTISSLVMTLLLSILIAVWTQFLLKNRFFKVFYRTIWVILGATPTLLYVIFLQYIFDQTDYGLLNHLLLTLGWIRSPVLWFVDNPLLIVSAGISFYSTSSGIILLSAAINNIPEELFRAARIDGATDFSIISGVILPILKWPILLIAITQTIALATGYTFILLLTNGGPVYDTTTLSFYSYQTAFGMHHYGYGSAISLLIVAVVFLLTFLQLRLFGFHELLQKPRIE